MLGILLALIVTSMVVYMILKQYKTQAVLVFGGLILMSCAVIFGLGTILPAKESTGLIWFDLFEFIKKTLSGRAAGLGLSIMAVGGFARYMDHIGASKALVNIAIKPLQRLHAPYVMLAACYLVGQVLGLFINSASGLGMLLMVTMFPILVRLGVSRLAATAVIGTTLCLDWSPGDPGSVLSANTAGMDIATYWTQYQIPVALTVMVVVAVLHYFVQQWFDKKQGHIVERTDIVANKTEEELPPGIFALLPVVPLVLILAFSDIGIKGIKMDIVNAMFISLFVSMIFEFLRKRDVKKVFADLQVFFDGMGIQFAAVVTLVVAGETFAQGLKSVGAIESIISSAQSAGFGGAGMIIVMVSIIAVSSVVMGSGNAPFFAFVALTPVVAAKMDIAPVLMLLPMHFAASIARSMSPITAVIVVVSGIANVSPIDVVKRTSIPMIGALIVNVAATFIYFYR
ncbi:MULTISPECIES: C4-dicarboxylate transporter DcuC [Pelosinus]|jgi:DcuC family C4-dicarboxylate transporter|uniref:Anaerobic c4-dicarboxylate antiporter, DcuC family n=1 Tax=Pelosinus fermentans B4 TaxID=1149862 RepID=I8RK35_9FIRM|nr:MULTISPECIES: C4-dicarboxylate transporter DcuC [Pelosinus]EIW20468.1 anaerobic c4-dicarboxylate antiporter, DcuC family [Pelosinus fermentans B4]EIW25817.1 anaerobic c4-dicarboxylate antiporter, DcuC family [Pelosinus fermentans A11]OAM93541.1 anaerobic c4-dicarboxylate antiporter, DcuC family [Pelosinus fermentans DSM 17108]SDQ81343.1 C4-dicarboxylate transporter, DcuC family [Pelosinus fermentans]